ncbi:MAG: glycosyltransferase family 2 protein [Acidobacteria bacterium]|nr:glycosyltransferase family 2 protein [Acidobacteriota bacterium]
MTPVYRNADTLRELHQRLERALAGLTTSYEIVFVNDGCPAGSGAVLRQLEAEDSHVRVIDLERNEGQHRAVRHGLRAARGKTVVVLDADLQDPPEVIPILVGELWRGPARAVFAGRRGEYQAATRMATSRVFKYLMHCLTGVPRDAGSQVAMAREVVDRLLLFPVQEPYTLALIGSVGLPMISVPMARPARPAGCSAYTERARLRLAWSGLKIAIYLRWWKWTH